MTLVSSPFRTAPGRLHPPLLVQVEISSRCNLKCRMCPLTLETTLSSVDPGLMEDATWEQVLRMGKEAGQVTIAGFGEPMTHPRFRGMLAELDAAGIDIAFSTNGIGCEKLAPALAGLERLKHVNISIDSPDAEIYHEIRGGDVERALSGARAIAASLGTRVPVTVNVVVMKANLRSLMAFPAILHDMGIRYLVLQSLHDYTDEMEQEHLHTGRTLQMFRPSLRLHVVLDELLAECKKFDVELLRSERVALDSYMPWESARKYFRQAEAATGQTRVCTIPFDNMYVDSAGRVFPCCHSASGPLLGDMSKETIEQVWNGEASRAFRQAMLDPATTPEVCRKCTIVPWGDHPYRLYSAVIETAERSADGRFRLIVRNAGTVTWNAENQLRLGTTRPHDRPSQHYAPSWDAPNRVATMADPTVAPGASTVLEFDLVPAPEEEFFELLIEGKSWLPGTMHSYNFS